MKTRRLKDEPFDVGAKTVRLNSLEHLRYGNAAKRHSRAQLLTELGAHLNEPYGAILSASDRLKLQGPQVGDYELLSFLLSHGQGYGLAGYPCPDPRAELLLAAAAYILEDNAAEHPNDLLSENH